MQNMGYLFDRLLRNHVYKIIAIHLINYQPFEELDPGCVDVNLTASYMTR